MFAQISPFKRIRFLLRCFVGAGLALVMVLFAIMGQENDRPLELLWLRAAGGEFDDRYTDVAVDQFNDVFATGYFSGINLDFGDGFLLSSPSVESDMILAKYSGSDGRLIWVATAAGIFEERGRALAIDEIGDVYVTGHIGSPNTMFGSEVQLSTNGDLDIFIAKYSGVDGNLIWAESFGGPARDSGIGMAIDSSGNVVIAGGSVLPDIEFAPGIVLSSNSPDLWVAKLNGSDGSAIWAQSAGGGGLEWVTAISVDAEDNVLITGPYYSPDLDFGAGALPKEGRIGGFFAKMSGSDGSFIWAHGIQGSGDGYGNDIASDPEGNVLVAGYFKGADLDFGSGTLLSSLNADERDGFVAKYNADGEGPLWVTPLSGSLGEILHIACGDTGDVWIIGYFQSPVLEIGDQTISSNGERDIVLLNLRGEDGFPIMVDTIGGSNWDIGESITLDSENNVVIAGTFGSSEVDFGDGIPTSSSGRFDMYIAKYDQR